jgi:hypothetical protein
LRAYVRAFAQHENGAPVWLMHGCDPPPLNVLTGNDRRLGREDHR